MMRTTASKLAVRQLSTAAKETPRETVARNILFYRAIRKADTAEELQAVVKAGLPKLEASAVEAYGLQGYLNRSFSGSTTKFVKDSSAWQNKGLADLIATESARADTWPFVFGFG